MTESIVAPPQQILTLIAADDAMSCAVFSQSLYRMTPNVKNMGAVTNCAPVFLIGEKDFPKDEWALQAMMNAGC